MYLISKHNNISDLNLFLEDNYKSLNYLGKQIGQENNQKIEAYIASNTNQNINSDVSLDEICYFYITLSKYYSKTFSTICMLFCRKISQLIIQKDLYEDLNNLILKYISEFKSIKDIKLETSDSESKIDILEMGDSNIKYLVEIISNLTNKDSVFKNYHKYLMLRLINYNSDIKYTNYQEKVDQEEQIIKFLKVCFSSSQIYILKRTISDYSNSFNNKKDFLKIPSFHDQQHSWQDQKLRPAIIYNTNINTTIVTTNIWDLKILKNPVTFMNTTDSYHRINDTGLLYTWIQKYSENYKWGWNNSRSLDWYLHIGKVEIVFTSDIKKCKLCLLPIQMLILEQFNDVYELTMEEIINFDFLSNHNEEEIKRILSSFIKHDILYLHNQVYHLNLKLDKDYIDLRDEYLNSINIVNSLDSNVEELIENLHNKFCHEIIDIVKCNINSLLKISNLNHKELFSKCKENIKLFDLSNKCFQDAVDYMISRDYVKIEENKEDNLYSIYSKIYY